jgi:hypothetical protein
MSWVALREVCGLHSGMAPLRAILGMLGIGRSSSADVAAKAITARTSWAVSVGKSTTISPVSAPSARLTRIVRTVTRVPLIIGWPPHTPGSRIIRSVYSMSSPVCSPREHALTVVRTAQYIKGCRIWDENTRMQLFRRVVSGTRMGTGTSACGFRASPHSCPTRRGWLQFIG